MTVVNAVLFAFAAFAASFVVIGLAWMLGRGKAAAVRHLIWTGAFAALLALPVAALLLPSQVTWLVPAAPAVTTAPVAAPTPPAPAFDTANVIFAIAAVWLLGVVFHLLKLALGGIGLIVLYRRSVAHIPHGIDATPFHGLSWQLRLRTSPGDAGPLTWGVLRPVVLLPKASVTWPRERLASVLLHEAAHVRSRDCLCRLIAIAACALYWPNPLVWFAARAMRRDAESAADDAVLTAGVKPTCYAEHLVGLAREFSGTSFAMTLSMAERRMLDTRVQAILDPAQPRSGVNKMDVLKLGVATLALTAGLALLRPALAETPAPGHDTAAPAATGKTVAVAPEKKQRTRVVVRTVVRSDEGAEHVIERVEDRGDPSVTPPEPPEPPVAPEPSADVPPAPPAPSVLPAPPAPPAPPHVRTNLQIEFRDADKAALRRLASAETKAAMEDARRALAEVKINLNETVAKAMRQAEQSMREAHVNEAQAKKALAAMDLNRVIADAMKKAAEAMDRAEHARHRDLQDREKNSQGDSEKNTGSEE